MMGMLTEAKQKMEDIKKKLATMTVEGSAEGGKVKVTAYGNRTIKDITIDPSLAADTERLEDLVLIATNNALEKAADLAESEMKSVTKGMVPGLSDFF